MQKLKVAYLGTPDFAARLLEKITEDTTLPIELKLVVTQPDQKAGRKQILTPTPVKVMAQKHNIRVVDSALTGGPKRGDPFEGLSLENGAVEEQALSILKDVDLAILYAYGKMLPNSLLTTPKYGFLNVHPSLLPKYRGVSPMAFSLMMGDEVTGVTLIKLDTEMDHGPIMAQKELPIDADDRRPDLETRLTDLAFELLKSTLSETMESVLTPQNHESATFTFFLNRNHGFIPEETFTKLLKGEPLSQNDLPQIVSEYCVKNNVALPVANPRVFYNLYRGLYPWPGLWTFARVDGQQKRLKITEMRFENNKIIMTKGQLEGKIETAFKNLPIS